MSKSLIIVESPAKARTLKKYLGKDYDVKASVGHIRDLPVSKLGVEIEKDFSPQYVTIKGKGKIISDLKKAAKKADDIYLALYEELTNYIEGLKNKKFLNTRIGRALVALQADVSRRVRSRGYELKKSPRGTAGEVPLSKPFPVNKQTWKYAIRADSPLIFRPNGTCYFNHNAPEGKSESENEENKQPHPVYKKNGEDYSTRKIVQTDTRFPRGKDPIEYLAYLAADGKTEQPGVPLDDSDLGSDWD